MNETIKILILEDDAEDCKQFEICAKEIDGVTIVGCTANAEHALAIARNENPNAIIIDLELHFGSGNGLQFLSDLKKSTDKTSPFLLVTTNNSSRTTHEIARSLGADFILTKYENDYSASYVLNFLKMIHATTHNEHTAAIVTKPSPQTNSSTYVSGQSDFISVSDIPEFELTRFIREELLIIGINPKSAGFQYLTDAVLIKLKDSNVDFYTVLGLKYKKSDPSIERAMQYAINVAWRTGDPDELLSLYTARINSERGVPTIMEFVYFYVFRVQNHFKIK